jgi:hypothetical protein
MTTEKQQQANRRNARKSTGPKTPEGKARSSGNALTYGIFGQGLFIAGENPEEYAELLRGLNEDLRPVGALEIIHVERIAMAVWRQRRLMRAESAAVGFRQQAKDTRKMLNDTLGIADSAKFKDKHLVPLSEDEMKAMASIANVVEELSGLKEYPSHEEALKKVAPVYFNYLQSEAEDKNLLFYKYLINRTHLPEEQQAAAIKWCIEKDKPAFQSSLHAFEMRLQVMMLREKFQEMKAVPPEAELFVRYQTTLDNTLTRAIRGLREAQTLRLSVLEGVKSGE